MVDQFPAWPSALTITMFLHAGLKRCPRYVAQEFFNMYGSDEADFDLVWKDPEDRKDVPSGKRWCWSSCYDGRILLALSFPFEMGDDDYKVITKFYTPDAKMESRVAPTESLGRSFMDMDTSVKAFLWKRNARVLGPVAAMVLRLADPELCTIACVNGIRCPNCKTQRSYKLYRLEDW